MLKRSRGGAQHTLDDYDTTLFILRGGCGGEEIVCDSTWYYPRQVIHLEAGESVAVVLEAAYAGAGGGRYLTIVRTEEGLCANGLDDDDDGADDCNDGDCSNDPVCCGEWGCGE